MMMITGKRRIEWCGAKGGSTHGKTRAHLDVLTLEVDDKTGWGGSRGRGRACQEAVHPCGTLVTRVDNHRPRPFPPLCSFPHSTFPTHAPSTDDAITTLGPKRPKRNSLLPPSPETTEYQAP
jgi:hypothetical protein